MVPRARGSRQAWAMARCRQRSSLRFARLSATPDDLYDYVQSLRPRAKPHPVDQGEAAPIVVTDDWPEIVPITDVELRVMEAHFADVLDEIFGPKG